MRLSEILFMFVCNKISFLLCLYIQVKNNFALTLKKYLLWAKNKFTLPSNLSFLGYKL